MSSQSNSPASATPNSYSSFAVERFQDSPVEEALRRWGVAAVALAVLLSGFMGFLSWRSAEKAAEDADWVAHTHDVMTRLETTLTDTVDVETGARGFVATDAEVFLEPYQAGQTAVRQDLETLRRKIGDPGQLRRLHQLEVQINARIEGARRKVAERRETGAIPAASVFVEGKRRMDAVRATVKEMEWEEGRLLEAAFGKDAGGATLDEDHHLGQHTDGGRTVAGLRVPHGPRDQQQCPDARATQSPQ